MLADWQRRSPRRSQRVAAREEKTACRRHNTRPEKKACTEATRVKGRSLFPWEKRQFPARRAPLSLSGDSHACSYWLASGRGTRVRVSAGESWAWSGKAWCPVPGLCLTSCVALGRPLSLSEPPFLPSSEPLWRVSWSNRELASEQGVGRGQESPKSRGQSLEEMWLVEQCHDKQNRWLFTKTCQLPDLCTISYGPWASAVA